VTLPHHSRVPYTFITPLKLNKPKLSKPDYVLMTFSETIFAIVTHVIAGTFRTRLH